GRPGETSWLRGPARGPAAASEGHLGQRGRWRTAHHRIRAGCPLCEPPMTGPPPGRGDGGAGLPGEGRNRLPERLVNRLAPAFVTKNVARHRETESRPSKSK